jgi:hypothetical protein
MLHHCSIDLLGGTWRGAFEIKRFSKSAPYPPVPGSRPTPGRSSLVPPARPSLSLAPGRCARCSGASCYRALSRHRASLARHRGGLFFRRSRRRFAALRLRFRSSQISSWPMNNCNGTAAHRAVEVPRLLPGVWRLVVPRAVFGLFPNHLQDPFCRQQPACCPAIGKSRGYGRKWSLTRPAPPESCLPAPPRVNATASLVAR